MPRRRAPALAAAALLATLLLRGAPSSHASPSSSATMLVAQGREKEASGDELTALKRYGDALALDPTCEPAYLALGALRERRGELGEAEAVYGTGMLHVPTSIALVAARGRVRQRLGRLEDAATDLGHALAAAPPNSADARSILVSLAAVRRALGQPAAELAVWRRLLVVARAESDLDLAKKAALQAHALSIFVGEVDPALRGREGEDAVRRTLAAIARRQ